MSRVLPSLRPGLDIMPSPTPAHPGLILRDPFHYTDAVLLIPPIWVLSLPCLDGQQTELDLQAMLERRTGQKVPSEAIRDFVSALQSQGLLDTEEFHAMREKRRAAFRDAAERQPAHAGSAYPDDAEGAKSTLRGYFEGEAEPSDPPSQNLVGIAAPHVSPEGGWRSYAAAYRKLTPDLADRTFVLLGTSHYGEPEKFGLTRKPYVTPLGAAETDRALMDRLVAGAPKTVVLEDYCHSIEHSIEFQVLFLQYMMPRPVKILPVLCGSFAESLTSGEAPESAEELRRFFEMLGEMADHEGKKLFWLLGIDMAHMGMRYGDNFKALAGQGRLEEVGLRDTLRLKRACAGDSAGFFDLVKGNQDDLKWCGYSALYTFLRALPSARGRVLRYEQWNIDPQSVVSFAGIEFSADSSNQS